MTENPELTPRERKRKPKEPPKAKPFFPDHAMVEGLVALAYLVLLTLAALVWPGVAGPAADPSGDYEPESFVRYSFDSLPEWLVAIGIGLIIGFVILLFFIPRLDPGERRSSKAKRVVITTAVIFIAGWLGLYVAYGFFSVPQGSNNTPGVEWGLCYRCHGYWEGPRNALGVAVRGEVPDQNCMQCHLDDPKLVNYFWYSEDRIEGEEDLIPAGLFPGSHRCSDCHNPHAPIARSITPGETRLDRMRTGGDTYVFPYRRSPGDKEHPSLPMNTCFRCHEFGFLRGGVAETMREYPLMQLTGDHPPLGDMDCLVCHKEVSDTGATGINCLYTEAEGDVHGLYGVQGDECAVCHTVTVPEE